MKITNLILASFVPMVMASTPAEAKPFGFIGASVQAQPGETLPVLDGSIGWTVKETGDQLGFLTYFWIQACEMHGVGQNWAQLYFGPTYNPEWAPWLTVGLHIGAQQEYAGTGTFRLRYATSLQVNVDKFVFAGFIEFDNASLTGKDRTGIGYDLIAKYGLLTVIQAEKEGDTTVFNLNLGLKAHRFWGIGPIVEFQIPVAFTTVWLAWAPLEPEGWQLDAVEGDKWNPARFWTGVAVGF